MEAWRKWRFMESTRKLSSSDLFSSETIGVQGQSTFGLMRVVSSQ
jgi:hypothetical protein